MTNIDFFYLKILLYLVVKFSIYLNRRVFVMPCDILICRLVKTFIDSYRINEVGRKC